MNRPADYPDMHVPGRQAVETSNQVAERTLGSQAIKLNPDEIRKIEAVLQHNLQLENQENQS